MKTSILTLCAVLLSASLSANEGGKGDAKWEACKADAEKLCQGVEPGGGRIMDCLKSREAELSEGCKAAGADLKKAKMGWEAACAKDKDAFCKGVEPGGGRVVACFKEHEKELSEGCRGFIGKKKGELMEKHPGPSACEADKETFCAGVKPGEGRIIDCMKAHREELSAGCREAMSKKGDVDGKKGAKKGGDAKP